MKLEEVANLVTCMYNSAPIFKQQELSLAELEKKCYNLPMSTTS